jgi:hypothetical protein
MTLFAYVARDLEGNVQSGLLDAQDASQATTALSGDGLKVEELHEATLHEREELPQPAQERSAVSRAPSPPQKRRSSSAPSKNPPAVKYHPLHDTLRLYAGWLLAFYAVAYALGAYQHTRSLPFRIPYAEAQLPAFAPLVFSMTLGVFLFLLLGTLHRTLRGGKALGFLFALLGILAFTFYRMNIPV